MGWHCSRSPPQVTEVLSVETARSMMGMLEAVTRFGTAAAASKLNPIGGKTGTTNNYTDAWFIGFSPSVTCGTWIGFDDRQTLGEKETGARAALPMWMSFMEPVIAAHPHESFATGGAPKRSLELPDSPAADQVTPHVPRRESIPADEGEGAGPQRTEYAGAGADSRGARSHAAGRPGTSRAYDGCGAPCSRRSKLRKRLARATSRPICTLSASGFGQRCSGRRRFRNSRRSGVCSSGASGSRTGSKSSKKLSTAKESNPKGGPVADVGDGIEPAGVRRCANPQTGDVDAIGGQELGIWGEVDRGHGVARAVSATRSRMAVDGEAATEQVASTVQIGLPR